MKTQQLRYFREFFAGPYEQEFFKVRYKLGEVHESIGLDLQWYVSSYYLFLEAFILHVAQSISEREEVLKLVLSLLKLTLLDIGQVVKAYVEKRERIIKTQARRIVELSTPILQITKEILLIPMLGSLDSLKWYEMQERALRTVEEQNARVLIMDISGIPVMDSLTVNEIIHTALALKIMGVKCFVTGINSQTAQLISKLPEVGLDELIAGKTLEDGITAALSYLRKERRVKIRND